VAIAFYFCHDYEAAIEAAKRTIRAYPEFPNTYRWLAAALGQIGRVEEAKQALEKAIALAPAGFDMYVRGACLGNGRRITPTCSKACARLDGRVDRLSNTAMTRQRSTKKA
jgi:tetratricopeptide (TPR) repeat protein